MDEFESGARGPSRRLVLGGGLTLAGLVGTPFGLAEAATPVVGVAVATGGTGTPISSLIYGSNEFGTTNGVTSYSLDHKAGVTTRRLGGDRLTGYNWMNNDSNAGTDYLNESDDYLPYNLGIPTSEEHVAGAVVSRFLTNSKAVGAASLATLQMGGYVAADDAGVVTSAQVAPSSRWHPTALSASDAVGKTNPVRLDKFVQTMVKQHGTAASGTGIRAYELDNEPALWPGTHPLLHPAQVTFAELIAKGIATATMVKSIDPSALIYGPVSFGFSEMFNLQSATDAGNYSAGGTWLGAYLQAMSAASTNAGVRLLDVLDFHWYPSVNGNVGIPFTTDESIRGARIQAPRSLWDPTYTEPSWIGQYFGPKSGEPLSLPLLPSIQNIVNTYFPGTQVAITEYNYGGDTIVETGMAVADFLGATGYQGLYATYHWGLVQNYVASAFRLYRNYDGKGGRFGDTALPATPKDPSKLSSWAAIDSATGRLHIVVINKATSPVQAKITLTGGGTWTQLDGFTFDGTGTAIRHSFTGASVTGSGFTRTLPASSVWHFVLA
jgi:hypothetical protein